MKPQTDNQETMPARKGGLRPPCAFCDERDATIAKLRADVFSLEERLKNAYAEVEAQAKKRIEAVSYKAQTGAKCDTGAKRGRGKRGN